MDSEKDLLELIAPSIKNLLEDTLESKFSIEKYNTIESNKLISDICFIFDLIKQNKSKTVFYFIDRKMMLNLIKVFSEKINNLDFNIEFLFSVIQELNLLIEQKLNRIIIKKTTYKDPEYKIVNREIIKGHQNQISDHNMTFKMCFFSSEKGDFIVAIPTQYQKTKEVKNTENKNYDLTEQSKSVLSAVQLIEMKKNVINSISEIRDLRGDADFLLRKAKAINDLTRMWFDINKEEN